ncbi:hypothetical protein BKA70DRAFT_1110283, partial [Coprinopsis sp. MPI-PUGE-AT-0042]
MSSRISFAKGDDPANSGKPFGGVNVIFLGDFCQLKPPKQPSLYGYALFNPTYAETQREEGVEAMQGASLWRQVKTVITLKKNERQSTDPIFGQVLENLR